MASDDDISRPPVVKTWRPEDPLPEEPVVAGPRWRRDLEPDKDQPSSWKRVRTFLLAAIALVLVVLLIWVSSWLMPPRPACLVLIGAGYEDNLTIPLNTYGRESLAALADLTREGKGSFVRRAGLFRLQREPIELRRDSEWDNGLDAFNEKTIIIYFALHGGSDAAGIGRISPYLLPQDADLGPDSRNRLRLEAIIERLGKMPQEKNKFLILDTTQLPAYWPLGMLHNDFARALKELEPEIVKIPNLAVLCASDSDQRSWVSDDWQRTTFAHYLIEGLRGAADDNNSGRINGWKLVNYVRSNVERWARVNCQALQTPLLLPQGAEGQRRAEAMYLTMVQEAYTAPDSSQLPRFTPPPELQQTWSEYRRLAEQVPAPAVYCPHLWREYQLVLLRYEQLMQSGHPASAATMAGLLRNLERQIQQTQRLDLVSLNNSLAMPAVAGLLGEPPQMVSMLNELWDAPAAEYRKKWAELQKQAAVDATTRRLLPGKMAELLLDRAAENPVTNLDKVNQLLHVIGDPLRPRPAEVHFLAMLRRDLPPPSAASLPPALVRQALRVHQQAERAALGASADNKYPYSEQVARWTGTLIQEGDRQRRAGEDLVFATDSASWDQAQQHLAAADKQYQQAQTNAGAVRSALAVRDQLLSMLPYYAQWLAVRRPAADLDRQAIDAQLLADVENLWEQAHRLTSQLERRPTAGGTADAIDFAALRELADSLDKKLRALEGSWTESWRESAVVDSPASGRSCADALVVPVTNPQLRMQLLTNYRRIARELLIRSTQNDPKAAAPTPADNLDQTQKQAQRQGRLALAVIGKRWFDQAPVERRETFQEVNHRLNTFIVEAKWWASLAVAGDQVAARWLPMIPEIDRQVSANRKDTDRDKARDALMTADRLTRQLPSVFCPSLTDNPADLYRRYLVQDLLLSQAQRTLDDHWYAEETKADRPYYRAAGLLYLDDVRRLLPKQAKQPLADSVEQRLNLPGDLVLSNPPTVLATSEQRFGVAYQLQAAPGAWVPPGAPVLWVEPERFLQALDPAPDVRAVRPIRPDRTADPFQALLTSPLLTEAETNPPPVPRRERTSLRVVGLYRGQRIERQTPVDLYPTPETTVVRPPRPENGSLTVRAPKDLQGRFGAGSGAIAIVLDASGSMGEPPGRPYTPKTKYNEVTGALRQVLQKLPKGTTVSLWVFGQAIGAAKTTERPEQTIERILPPTTWDPQDPEQLKKLMARIQYPALEPWNESPIVRTMLRAKEDLKDAPGFKTLLVLTDGMDNRFLNDREYNPKQQEIPTALRENFQNSGIVINVVGFKIVSREEAAARQQFKVIEDFPLPGKFVTVTDVNELAITLEKAMRQRLRYWLDHEDNSVLPNVPGDGLDVSTIGANDQWFPGALTPAGYKVRTYTTQRVQKSVIIQPGDLLMVQLTAMGKNYELRRGLYSRDDFPGKPWQSKADWRLAVLQNQRIGDRGLQMLATLEKNPTQQEAILQVIRPRQTWLELKPQGEADQLYAQRWAYRWGYPAPAWTLDVPSWPMRAGVQVPALPSLRVWWNPDQEWPASAVVERDATVKSLLGLTGRTVPVEGDKIGIESIQVEKHMVESQPGTRAVKSCLVVRLNYPAQQPVWARIRGLAVEGQEHRFYTEAGRYTGLFWPVTEEEANQMLTGVGVISLNSFKRNAEQRGYYEEMDKLVAPQASDVRPLPPVELK